MSKLRLQGGKLCVVAGQIEQCCETPGGCFAYLSACGCVDPAGEFVVPASLVYDTVEQRYWPVYFQAATSTDPAQFFVLVKVSKTLDPGIPFNTFFRVDGFRERCNSTDCQPGSIRLDMRTRVGCPANTICFCARYGITDFSFTYQYRTEQVIQPPNISCPTYTLRRTTDIIVNGFVVYDRQTDQVVDFLVGQQISTTGNELGDIGGGCPGIVGELAPFSSLIVSTDIALAGFYSPLVAPISVLATGNGAFALLDYGVVPNNQAPVATPDFPVIAVSEFPCTTEFSYRVDYPFANLEGDFYQTVDYRVSPISRYNRHTVVIDAADPTPTTGTVSINELRRTEIRQAFRYTDNPNIDVGEGTIFDDECLPGDQPDPPNPLGNVQQGDPQGGVLPGGTGRSGADNVPRRSYPRPCLPCQQRREAGLQAALDAQRRASNCQGCGDAGLDGVL